MGKRNIIWDTILDNHFPQSRATYATAFVGVACFFISLRWLFSYPDPSQFLTFLIFSLIFFVLAYLIETVDFNRKKFTSIESKLDSLLIPSLGNTF